MGMGQGRFLLMVYETLFWAAVAITLLLLLILSVGLGESLNLERQRQDSDRLQKSADDAHARRMNNEIAQEREREPGRVRRQLAADLVFPGMYSTDALAFDMRKDGVYNWILTGPYTTDDPRHSLMLRKVKQLEAEERAEALHQARVSSQRKQP